MPNRSQIIIFSLLLICPSTSFAWHDYRGHWYANDWDYYGSGRDHPYSVYIDQRYSGYGGYTLADPVYIDTATLIEPHEFTVNIPNNLGGYTAVVLKRSGTGFIGPQGEYYPEFPKVSQLKIIYGQS